MPQMQRKLHLPLMPPILPLLPLLLLSACAPSESHTTDDAFQSLVAAERAFAARSVEAGTKTAFLEFFAEDGVVFDAGPVNVRTVWEPRPSEGPVLFWGPEVADVSAAGDLGFSSGPYSVRMDHESEPVAWGHFVSVWKRDSSGTWSVVADGGIVHGPASLSADSIVTRLSGGDNEFSSPVAATDSDAASTALAITDSEYSRSIVAEGFGESYDPFVDEAARFYRNGHLPFVGITTITDAAPITEIAWSGAEAHGTVVSSSGDLGCTYGVVRLAPDAAATETEWSASYYRLWKRDADSDWRVVVDVLIPRAPSSQ